MLCHFYSIYKWGTSNLFKQKIVIVLILRLRILILRGLLVVQLVLSKAVITREPQITALESGFERLNQSLIISSSFFVLAVLFVIFDVELILLFPGVVFHSISKYSLMLIILSLFLVVLLTLLLEWVFFGLKWFS